MDKRNRFITTYTGMEFDVFNPNEDNCNIQDIAHALSNICRYNGHCYHFYSVAQHSIGVSTILKELGYDYIIQLYGLLHDASEAYICDMPKPIKYNMPQYHQVEKNLQNFIFECLGMPILDETIHDTIKKADNIMLMNEVKVLMADWKSWNIPQYDVDVEIEIKNESMSSVEDEFMALFRFLCVEILSQIRKK